MSTAVLGNPNLFPDDSIIYGSANGTGILTKGDWVQWSGAVIAGLGKDCQGADASNALN